MADPQIVVRYVADTSQLQTASAGVGTSAGKAGAMARKAFLPAVAALGLVAVGANRAVQAASALNEQISASNIVFGKHAKEMQDWSKTGAKAFGLSQREALAAANAFGNMALSSGLTQEAAAGLSQNMVQLAGDMASFHDQDPSEMLQRLQSGLAGEAEPLRKFGVLLSEGAVKTKAYQLGIAQAGAELSEAQKVQARYALIMESTSKAQGDFARTSDSVANKQRTLAAETENTTAAFGKSLLPVMQALQTVVGGLIGLLAKMGPGLTILVGAFTALAAAIVLTNTAMAAYRAVTIASAAVTALMSTSVWALTVALLANPITWVVLALVALAAGLVIAYLKIEAFRNAVNTAFDWIKRNWPLLLPILLGPIGVAVGLIIKYWDQIRAGFVAAMNAIRAAASALAGWGGWDAIGRVVSAVFNAIKAVVNAVIEAIKAVISAGQALINWGGWGAIGGVFRAAFAPAIAIIGSVVSAINGIKSAVDAAIGWLGRLDSTSAASKRQLDALRRSAASAPNVVLGRGARAMAAGGLVTQPTLALLGEAGPELVVPLSGPAPAGAGPISVRVFIGDRELRGLIRTEVVANDTRTARTLLAGGR